MIYSEAKGAFLLARAKEHAAIESGISAFGLLHKLTSIEAESAVTVVALLVSIGAVHIGFQVCAFCDILYVILRPYLRDRYTALQNRACADGNAV